MAGGHLPSNETALGWQIDRAIERTYGARAWTVKTTRLTPGRAGIPDRLICLDGYFYAFELKHPTRSEHPNPRQQRELYELMRAGAVVAVVRSVERALAILDGTDPGDPLSSFTPNREDRPE